MYETIGYGFSRFELVKWPGSGMEDGGHLKFNDFLSALAFLKKFSVDSTNMASMRRFLVKSSLMSGVSRVKDAFVLEQIARGVANGSFFIRQIKALAPQASGSGASSRQNQSFQTKARKDRKIETDGSDEPWVLVPEVVISPTQQAKPESNWVDLQYLYADGSGVAGAQYEVSLGNGAILATGGLDAEGAARVSLPLSVVRVNVRYFSDPKEVAVLESSHPQIVEAPAGWFESMSRGLEKAWETTKDAAQWTWGTLQGDFNEDQTVSQIITNAIITAIPVVDQVADGRDLVAAVKQLAWDKRYNEIGVWIALLFCLIGLVPTVGSLLKGVLKLVWKGAKLDKVLELFNHFMKGNGVRWLRELQGGKLKQYINDAAAQAHKIFSAAIEKLEALKPFVPEKLKSIKQQVDETLANLDHVKSMINEKFAAIGDQLNEKLGRLLAEQTDDVQSGGARTVVRKQQNAQTDAIFENQPKSLRRTATSGARLVADPEKTTTVLGRFGDDMEEIINELEYPKTLDFGEKKGGFNVLNVPDDRYINPDQFWNEYNKPFLDKAIERGDNIVMATKPDITKLRNLDTGELTGFGREYEHLVSNGYVYDPATNMMVRSK